MSRISIPTLRKQAELSTHGVVTTYEAAALGRVVLALVDSAEALRDILDAAERTRSGDPSLDPEEWYVRRDYARIALARFDFGDGQ